MKLGIFEHLTIGMIVLKRFPGPFPKCYIQGYRYLGSVEVREDLSMDELEHKIRGEVNNKTCAMRNEVINSFIDYCIEIRGDFGKGSIERNAIQEIVETLNELRIKGSDTKTEMNRGFERFMEKGLKNE